MGDDLKDIQDELRMFFGCGTQLQELYMTPQLMTPEMWDALAEAAKWSRNNPVRVRGHAFDWRQCSRGPALWLRILVGAEKEFCVRRPSSPGSNWYAGIGKRR